GATATATSITDVWTTSGPSPLAATNPGSRTATVGTAISPLQLQASGGTTPYTWSAVGLPSGLTISSTGSVSGTPTTVGTYTVTATVHDAAGANASTTFTWKVAKKHGGPKH
ncbi:MAG TPA: Ig domain-containing protein, partial [Jatrophihabitantaceae bacterium]|nr:Ig domain-containing protein [Jatrophihabitantaceae bacterium]